MAFRVTSAAKEEGAEVEGAENEGRTVVAAGSSVSTCGHFGRSWASFHLMAAASMTHMTGKNELITSLRIPINIYEG